MNALKMSSVAEALGLFRKSLLVITLGISSALAQDPSLRFGGEIPPEVDTIYERGLAWWPLCQPSPIVSSANHKLSVLESPVGCVRRPVI